MRCEGGQKRGWGGKKCEKARMREKGEGRCAGEEERAGWRNGRGKERWFLL